MKPKTKIEQRVGSRQLWIGISIGVAFSALVAVGVLLATGQWTPFASPPAAPPAWRATLNDPSADLVDNTGQAAADAPAYLDITAATIRVGVQPSDGEPAPDAPLIASVTITMAAAVPPPPEQETIFSLGVAIDRDGDLTNNDTRTPGLRGTDTTVAINCDPQHGRCLEGIATLEQNNWTLRAAPINWRIDGQVVRLDFRIDFLPDDAPESLLRSGWRVFTTVLDPQAGGPTATDVTPAEDAPLAKVTA